MAGAIDIDAERARLNKEIEKATKEVKGLEGRLNNESFVAKAPAHVVEEQRRRKEEAEGLIETLNAALERLAAMG